MTQTLIIEEQAEKEVDEDFEEMLVLPEKRGRGRLKDSKLTRKGRLDPNINISSPCYIAISRLTIKGF